MPKLKVPGESLKDKFRPHKAPELSSYKKNHHLKSKSSVVPRSSSHREEKRKLKHVHHKKNGLVRHRNDFYKVFGVSDEEIEWEGFSLNDISSNGKDRNIPLIETTQRPISPISSIASSLSPPSSPPPPLSSYRSSLYVGGASKHKTTPTPMRKRRTRCMECRGCLKENDCGKCVNCLDKPKFGGPNSRKQACIHRKCSNLIRDVPLKSTLPQKRPANDSNLPSSKRPSTKGAGEGGLVPSPLRPRRVVPFKSSSKDTTRPLVQLYWPDTLISTYPVYSSPLSSLPSSSSFDICTRCGSHGNEGFTYCQYCSQPYHLFCADIKETPPTGTTPNFVCSQCVNCQICGQPDKCVNCSECKHWFHPSCLLGHTSDPRSDNRNTWRCVQCTKCLSCHRNTPNKVEGIGNYVLSSLLAPTPSWSDGYCYCTDCYSLKAKGNSCPVCGECYLDNDFDSKMVQCSRCDSWIHSHCEKMSDEEYEILSDLPDSVEFICKLCMVSDGCGQGEEKKAESWRDAVNEYKKESFKKIVSLMKKSLGSLWVNDINVTLPLVTVAKFVTLINEHLGKCAQGVHTGSHKHRLLYNAQQNYNAELEEVFPWFSLNKEEEEKKREAPPTLPPTPSKLCCNIEKWPSFILNDHNYMSCDHPRTSHSNVKLESDSVAMETTPKDNRVCILCTVKGDQPPNDSGRLLPCGGVDEWIHVNCALWSAEVYEDENGYLCCVHSAVGRGQRLKCDKCHIYGATVGCCHSSCSSNYHYLCARKENCIFLNNKEVYCPLHSSLCDDRERVPEGNMKVDRCVLIHTDNDRPGRKINKLLPPDTVRLRIGSLIIHSLGRLTCFSDTVHHSLLVPHHFSSSSHFWSTLNPAHRTSYTLTIKALLPPEEEPLPLPPPIKETPPTSPEDYNWPCVSGEVNEECGHWTALSSMDHILASPSLIQTAHMLLKASDGFPVSESLKTFRIPRKTHPHHTPSPTPTINKERTEEEEPKKEKLHPLDSRYLSQWERGLLTNATGIQYTLTTGEGQCWEGSDLKGIWERVLSDLHESRRKLDLPYIPYCSANVYNQFGLNIELVLQLLEQLPNQEKCSRHSFLFHEPVQPSNWQKMRPIINRTGCARSEGYNGIRSETDMFSFLMSQWRPDPPQPDPEAVDMAVLHAEYQGSSNLRHQAQNDVPVAMRYRACQRTYHDYVSVFTSRIHGLGLFCLQEIESGDMVIEYAGTVIRSILTDYRERYYESRGIGCYMFRIDNDEVVDATMSGNMARFINHSCEPNCYSKVVAVDGQKKIMIFALRKIIPGEELTYDYKFPIEDAKIPCKCGAARCRKTLN